MWLTTCADSTVMSHKWRILANLPNSRPGELDQVSDLNCWDSKSLRILSPIGERVKCWVQMCTSSLIRKKKRAMEMQTLSVWLKSWLGCVSLLAGLSRSLDAAMEKYPVPAWRTRWQPWVGNPVGNLRGNLFKFVNYAKRQSNYKKEIHENNRIHLSMLWQQKHMFNAQEDNKKMKMQRLRKGESHWIMKKSWKRNYFGKDIWDLKATTLEAAFATSWKSFLEGGQTGAWWIDIS